MLKYTQVIEDYQITFLWVSGCNVFICMHVQSYARVHTHTDISAYTRMRVHCMIVLKKKLSLLWRRNSRMSKVSVIS